MTSHAIKINEIPCLLSATGLLNDSSSVRVGRLFLQRSIMLPCRFHQVTRGGNFDVDVTLTGPNEKIIYQKQRKQFDSIDFTTTEAGEYYFCFSNEFSSFTHKVVYFDFAAGDEPPLTEEIGQTHKAFTQLEMSLVKIHEALTLIRDYQTHHRLRESMGRDAAEYLSERVQYYSLGEAVLLVFVGLCQVFILRRFFTNKRNSI